MREESHRGGGGGSASGPGGSAPSAMLTSFRELIACVVGASRRVFVVLRVPPFRPNASFKFSLTPDHFQP